MNKLCLLFNIDCPALVSDFEKAGITANTVPQSMFSQSVGTLAGECEKSGEVCFNPFKEQLALFCYLGSDELDGALALMRKHGFSQAFKAVKTPVNTSWRVDALVLELKKEREQIARMKK